MLPDPRIRAVEAQLNSHANNQKIREQALTGLTEGKYSEAESAAQSIAATEFRAEAERVLKAVSEKREQLAEQVEQQIAGKKLEPARSALATARAAFPSDSRWSGME